MTTSELVRPQRMCPSCAHPYDFQWHHLSRAARAAPPSVTCLALTVRADGDYVIDDICRCHDVWHAARRHTQSCEEHATGARSSSPDEASGTRIEKVSTHRKDIQGLRALAVGLVVLYHAGVPKLTGGYVGVDVFFVISGFVITQLLLTDLRTTGRVSILRFYGRRAQRIVPLAGLVIVATVAASYNKLGFVRGGRVALDGQYAASFVANLRFATVGTNYLNSQTAPSPLQHYWSLSVEEQFYLVWPVLLWALYRAARTQGRHRWLLPTAMLSLMIGSYCWSVVQTHNDDIWAYFSTLTRAGELMAGALVAVLAHVMTRAVKVVTQSLALLGLAGVLSSAFLFSTSTAFPGSAVALPVSGAALLLLSGAPSSGRSGPVQYVLGSRPLVFLGNISFSLYLWHWPLLTIAQEARATPLPASERAILVFCAIALSIVSYYAVENPLRQSAVLKRRPAISIAVGAIITAGVFGYLLYELYSHA